VEASRVFVTVLPFVFVVVDLDHLDMDLSIFVMFSRSKKAYVFSRVRGEIFF
jgi:hypothetical protein